MIRISTATEVLAAIPALLGFTPVQSIVSILLGEFDKADGSTGTRVVLAARNDIDVDATDMADQLCRIARRENVTSTILVAVASGADTSKALDGIAVLRNRLEADGIATTRSLHTPDLNEGAMWSDVDTLECGVVADPATSAVHAAAVYAGRTIETSRSAIATRYGLAAEADPRIAAQTADEQGDDFARTTLSELASVVRSREIPSADLAARVGHLATTGMTQRDALLSLAHYGPAAAHVAMTLVSNQVRGSARVQTLTIAAYFAYVAGEGPEVGIAIEEARASAERAPEARTRLLELLDVALQSGMRPDAVAGLTVSGIECAQRLGFEVD